MLQVGPAEFMVIGLVLLIVVGPEQLPGLVRRVGRLVSQARDVTDGLRTEFMAGIEEIEQAADVTSWTESGESSAPKGSQRSKPSGGPTPAYPEAAAGGDGEPRLEAPATADEEAHARSEPTLDPAGSGPAPSAIPAPPEPFSGSDPRPGQADQVNGVSPGVDPADQSDVGPGQADQANGASPGVEPADADRSDEDASNVHGAPGERP